MLSQEVTLEPYISITRISPFNRPDPARRYVMLKAYYDGSEIRGAESRVLTLGGLSGSAAAWENFVPRWRKELEASGLRYWHTTDAMACKNDFSRDDWDADIAAVTLDALLDVICDAGSFRLPQERRLRAHFATVFLDDYDKVKLFNPNLRPAEAICVNGAVGPVVTNPDNSDILLYFDQNESFKNEMYRVWQKGKKSPKTIQREWALRVEAISDLDSRKYTELQAADAIAWVISRNHSARLERAPQRLARIANARAMKIFMAMYPDNAVYGFDRVALDYPAAEENNRYIKHVVTFGTEREIRELHLELEEPYEDE